MPLVGFGAVNADFDYRLRVTARFNVLDAGKLVSTYEYNKEMPFQGKAWSSEDVLTTYQRIFASLRYDLATTLDRDFLPTLRKPDAVASPAEPVSGKSNG